MSRGTLPTRSGLLPASGPIAAVVCMALLAFAAPAVAQDPVETQYDTPVTEATENAGSAGPAGTTSAATAAAEATPADESSGLKGNLVGGLPFTGLDVIALAAVALALASLGFALRRLTAPRRG